MSEHRHLLGIGIGPFNLSLAALLSQVPDVRAAFFDRKPRFDWHPELMFADSVMQTSYLKDLVTPVDPTNPYSFLNYLVSHDLFYSFLNTQRTSVSRREFELYCAWVAERLGEKLHFGSSVKEVEFAQDRFRMRTDHETWESDHLCIATGQRPRIPECARYRLSPRVFHAKQGDFSKLDLRGRSIAIVGGGQTGIEVFRNALNDRWGRASSVKLISRRKGLEPLDESAFTNDYFTPQYVDRFWELGSEKKGRVVAEQKLASDGNTPSYLIALYQDLYRLKHVERDEREIQILTNRRLSAIDDSGPGSKVVLENDFSDRKETIDADVVVLCTGFETALPEFLEPLYPRIRFDAERRFRFRKSYAIEWDGPDSNRIYALNFSRHEHGIVDPQTSLMAWRSAVVVNDLLGRTVFETRPRTPAFIDHAGPREETTAGLRSVPPISSSSPSRRDPARA